MWATVSRFAGACGYFISWFGSNATTRSHRSSRSHQRKKKRQCPLKQLARFDQLRRARSLCFRLFLEKGEGRVRVRHAVSKPELQIPSPQSSPLLQRGEAKDISSTTHTTFLTRTCRYVTAFLSLGTGMFCLTSCASVSHHQFSEPPAGWQTKTGQLMYRTAKTTLIGEAIVRLSNRGDFELTVSKGPGITLLSLRQDAGFAAFNANFTDQRWSGPTAHAPPQLRGWLGLRDQFLRAPNQKTLRYVSGSETFLFRF